MGQKASSNQVVTVQHGVYYNNHHFPQNLVVSAEAKDNNKGTFAQARKLAVEPTSVHRGLDKALDSRDTSEEAWSTRLALQPFGRDFL